MNEFITSIGGFKVILGAALSIVAALLTLYLKSKDIFPFKPRQKVVVDNQKETEEKLDEAMDKDLASYLDMADSIIDDAKRLHKIKDGDKAKTDK
ncbi:MAG: hypothetical protein ABFD50_21820 [Smithella sp.]